MVLPTHAQAQRQEVTLTLTATKGNMSTDVRTFTFADAFPVRWTGPQLVEGGSGTWGETLEIAHAGLKLP